MLPYFLAHATVDFEQSDDFILESKQINIPGHPHAFNPSIVRYRGKLLMSFREIAYPTYFSWIGLVWLDENFCPQGEVHHLNIVLDAYGSEDARLVTSGDKLYIIYNGNRRICSDLQKGSGGDRMYIGELIEENKNFYVASENCLNFFEGESGDKREKNWVPFDYENNLLLAYSLSPHRILKPLLGTESCETFDVTKSSIKWPWGELRGGTPALLDNDQYISFFHSSLPMKSVFSCYASIPHYFLGAYTFTKEPPFFITHLSPKPIMSQSFYEPNPYQPYWHPVIVVFPCGILIDKNYIWVTYGKHDHEIWMVKMDKEKLLKSLQPVSFFP